MRVRAALTFLILAMLPLHAATVLLKDGSTLSGDIQNVEWDFYSVLQTTKSGTARRIIPRSDVVKIDGASDAEKAILGRPDPDFDTSEEQNRNELPIERHLAVEALQAWYGADLDLKGDAALAKSVQRAEALIIGYLRVNDAAKRKLWLDELQDLKLEPQMVRAILQSGPYALGAELKTGRFRMRTPVNGVEGGIVNFTAHVPESYTSRKKWPVILLLHGTLNNGDQYMNFWLKDEIAAGYILIAPWANHAHAYGPSVLGRGQVFAALEWALTHYRVDPDRVYITGLSMGGAGAKRLAIFQPDRFAAACSDSGAPLDPSLEAQYKNLFTVPLYSWSGARDQLVPNAVVLHEKELAEALKLPLTYAIDPNGDHGSNPNIAADAVKFFEDKKRSRYPDRVVLASQEDEQGLRHHYVEITRADEAANVPYMFNVLNIMKVVDYPSGDLDRARDLKTMVEKGGEIIVDHRRMWRKARELDLHLDKAKNTVVLDSAALVRAFRIFVDDEMLDLDQEIKVSYKNQIVATQKITRSIAFMLEEARKHGRRDLSYWGAIDVKLAQ